MTTCKLPTVRKSGSGWIVTEMAADVPECLHGMPGCDFICCHLWKLSVADLERLDKWSKDRYHAVVKEMVHVFPSTPRRLKWFYSKAAEAMIASLEAFNIVRDVLKENERSTIYSKCLSLRVSGTLSIVETLAFQLAIAIKHGDAVSFRGYSLEPGEIGFTHVSDPRSPQPILDRILHRKPPRRRTLNPSDAELENWNAYYRLLRSGQLKNFQGEFIVIHQGNVIAHGLEHEELRASAAKQLGIAGNKLVVPFVDNKECISAE